MEIIKPNNTKEARFQEQANAVVFDNYNSNAYEFRQFADAYAAHVWVYVCVRAIAKNIASIPILPYVQVKDGSWIEDKKHELYQPVLNPNPYMSSYNLREYTASALKLFGNAYWYLERFKSKDVKEIWPLLPDSVRPVGSKAKLIDHYIYEVRPGVKTRLEYNEVIHFRDMNPASFIYGLGAMSAAKTTIATDLFAQVWNKAFFANAARPDGVLESDDSLDIDTIKRIKESWTQMYQGSEKHGKTAILDNGLKYKPISENAKDMDFINLRKDLRTEILASFGVPPSVVGLLEYANYSNMEQQLKAFWSLTLLPEIRNIEETLTIRARQISLKPETVFQSDLSNVQALQPDMKLLADTAQVWVNCGIPINQVIQAMDLPFESVEEAPQTQAQADQPKSVQKSIKDENDRFSEWKKYDDSIRAREESFKTSTRGFFKSQRLRVLKRLNENTDALLVSKGISSGLITKIKDMLLNGEKKSINDVISVIFDKDNEDEQFKSYVKKHIKGTFFDFAIKTSRKIDPNFDFNLNDPVAIANIEHQVFKLVRESNQYTLEQISENVVEAIQDAVASGFSEGESIQQIVDRIDDVYKFAVDTRAERIARTEVITAANAGTHEAMKKTGVKEQEWLSSRDDRVRESHYKMDGQITGIDGHFISPDGAKLKFPGDISAPPEERINCRCTAVPLRSSESQ